jgi:hypothetical protein
MPRTFVLVVLALAFLAGRTACHAQQQDSTGAGSLKRAGNEWIGTRYPPLPDRVTYRGGDNMSRGGGNTGNAPDENYSMSIIDVRGREMIWLNRVVGYTSEGRAKKVVTDVLVPSEVPDDYTLEFGICGTLRSAQSGAQPEPSDVKVDPEIIAVIRKGKTKVLTPARRAWRADRDARRFCEVDPEGIVCLNDALVGH